MSFKIETDESNEAEVQFEHFDNFKLESEVVLDRVRLGFCVFTNDASNPIIILHPALTGSPRAFIQAKGSQGDGWFNDCIGPDKFLDTTKYTVVCVDHLGGNGHSSSATELSEHKEFLSFQDEVNLIALLLERYGVSQVHAVIGGSIGGGQALEWLAQNKVAVNKILDISGHCTIDSRASEFFSIQRDLLWQNGQKIDEAILRLKHNHQDLIGNSKAFDFVFWHIISELQKLTVDFDQAKLLGIVRQIGFLRFVTPTFFDNKWQQFYHEREDENYAYLQLRSWIDHQAEIFPKRFSADALALLCHLDATARPKNPKETAMLLVSKNTALAGFMVIGDVLFHADLQQKFYSEVKKYLPNTHQHLCHMQLAKDEINGHDHFLSDSFQYSIPKLKEFLNG